MSARVPYKVLIVRTIDYEITVDAVSADDAIERINNGFDSGKSYDLFRHEIGNTIEAIDAFPAPAE